MEVMPTDHSCEVKLCESVVHVSGAENREVFACSIGYLSLSRLEGIGDRVYGRFRGALYWMTGWIALIVREPFAVNEGY